MSDKLQLWLDRHAWDWFDCCSGDCLGNHHTDRILGDMLAHADSLGEILTGEVLLSRWQPIRLAPRDGTAIFAAEPGCGMAVVHWYSGRPQYKNAKHISGWCDSDGAVMHPTHWMSMPPWPRDEPESSPVKQPRVRIRWRDVAVKHDPSAKWSCGHIRRGDCKGPADYEVSRRGPHGGPLIVSRFCRVHVGRRGRRQQ